MIQQFYDRRDGAGLTREVIIAHAIEPNTDPEKYGIPKHFKYRETYWEWGGATNPQSGTSSRGFLRKRGFNERAAIIGRWDLVGNDPYGRSVGMDALPDIKQLQQETRRKAQGIDKGINPPLVADVQLKNQPASLLPGGITFLQGMMSTGNDGMKPAYGNWKPDIASITADLEEVRKRIRDTFFNNLFNVASQFETRSNITAVEWDMRKAESLIMLGPVFQRLYNEVFTPIIDRVWGIMVRAGIMPDPPPEAAGQNITVKFSSLLEISQNAAQAGSIERMFQIIGQVAGIDPAAADNLDIDEALDIYSSLLNNSPRIIRSPAALTSIRQRREQQQQAAQQAELAEKYASAAQAAGSIDVGGGQNLVQRMSGIAQ
jgi:Bacteriophage head to tail connecting protein